MAHALRRLSRTRVALVVLLALLGACGIAFAATVGFRPSTLGAGRAPVATCTPSLRATYAVAWSSTTKAYAVSTVTLVGNTAGCPTGGLLTVELGDSSGGSLYEFSHLLTSAEIGSSASVVLSPVSTVAAGTLKRISVVVAG